MTTTLGPESWRPSGEHLCCRRSRWVAGGSAGAFVWQRLDLDLDSQDGIVFLHEYFLPGRLRFEQGEACEKQLCAWLRHFRLRPSLKRKRRIHFWGFDLSEGGENRIWPKLIMKVQ